MKCICKLNNDYDKTHIYAMIFSIISCVTIGTCLLLFTEHIVFAIILECISGSLCFIFLLNYFYIGCDKDPQPDLQGITIIIDYQKINNGEKPECSICLEKINETNVKSLNCKHVFHQNCLDNWILIKPNCRNCRSDI